MARSPREGDEQRSSAQAPFHSLTRSLLDATTVAGVLRAVVEAAGDVVAGADLAGASVRGSDGAFFGSVATDEVGAELDRVQYGAGEGPLLDAEAADEPHVTAEDLRTETRWPAFTAAAWRHGVQAVLATGFLRSGPAQPSGALTLYSRRAHGLTADDRDAALLLVTHGSLAIARCRVAEQTDLLRVNMKRAIESRDLIGQAKGILMKRQGISAEAAFDLLRRTSQDRNVKVVELARTIVARHGDLG